MHLNITVFVLGSKDHLPYVPRAGISSENPAADREAEELRSLLYVGGDTGGDVIRGIIGKADYQPIGVSY